MTTGWEGGSKVRSPKPSEMNTSTSCKSPLESVTTSGVEMSPGCCLAQVGSAAMLIGLALGTVPSNLTLPRMLGLVVAGAAFTICRLEIEIVRTSAIAASKVLYFILHLEEAYASKVVVSAPGALGYSAWGVVGVRRLARDPRYPS